MPAGAAPSASFTVSPAAPHAGDTVTLKSTSTSDVPASQSWDLDGNGEFGDASGATASVRFARTGEYPVALRVVDLLGEASTATQKIVVGPAPAASITYAPAAVVAGAPVTFTAHWSAFNDPVSQRWDLDGDRDFDDATGPTATTTLAAGRRTIRLRVADARRDQEASVRVRVAAAPTAPPASPSPPAASAPSSSLPFVDPGPAAGPAPALGILAPFPVVRVVGRATRRGTRLSLLSITAPASARYVVRCSGRGCPYPSTGLRAMSTSDRGTRTVRIRAFSRRSLRPGAVIVVRIAHSQLVGKYTSFRIRGRRAPLRRDRCLRPPTSTIFRC